MGLRRLARGALDIFNDIGGQALEISTNIGQGIGIKFFGPLFNNLVDMLIGGEVQLLFAVFQELVYCFFFETEHDEPFNQLAHNPFNKLVLFLYSCQCL